MPHFVSHHPLPLLIHHSIDTKSGSRGAVARKDICTNEYILQIPVKCMISPLHAFDDPVYGETLSQCKELLTGDTLLAVYIMIEMNKGSESFYYPYLKVVPRPDSVCHWNTAEIDLLQGYCYALHNAECTFSILIM